MDEQMNEQTEMMNTLPISVAEWTGEIGIRLAVGARSPDVRAQFLIESVVFSPAGGAFGIVPAASLCLVTKIFGGRPLDAVLAILTALFFSAAVGISFGHCPAHKAACLKPIEALRYEQIKAGIFMSLNGTLGYSCDFRHLLMVCPLAKAGMSKAPPL